MPYLPLNYDQINLAAGHYSPSMVKSYNNATFAFWQRALFQRACSCIIIDGYPESWDESVKNFMYYCLFKFGFGVFAESAEFGQYFQPCDLNGINFYYQPTEAIVSNPKLSITLTLGEDAQLIKLTPDYMGIFDIIDYYAEKLSVLDNAINMSLINNKFAFILGAKTRGAAEALKKMMDKINKGEPAVIYDMRIQNDGDSKTEPWQMWERKNLKESYLTTDQLRDFQTILNNFDCEIGIPTIPYEKKERMVSSEAESRVVDATSRSKIWLDTLNGSFEKVNKMFGTAFAARLRFIPEEVETNGNDNNDRPL